MSSETTPSSLKAQRDRFLAFAFAGADLMLEVDKNGDILYSLGAVRGVAGAQDGTLEGKNISDIFAPRDRGLVASLRARARAGIRFGPVLVNLNEEHTSLRTAMLSGVAMPDKPDHVYLTISRGSLSQVSDAKAERNDAQNSLLDKDSFTTAALEVIAASDTLGQKLDMTLVDVPESQNFIKSIGVERWSSFRENVTSMLRAYAADGRTAAALNDGRFGLVTGKDVDTEALKADIENLSRETDPNKKGITTTATQVDLSNDTLSERELARAVMYTISQFEKQGQNFNILSLEGGFETFLTKNAQKISDFKLIINQSRFTLKYQPIVYLKDGTPSHYEALVRFGDNASPYDSIVFCEDVGLSPELDLAICGRAINFLVFNAPSNVKLSVNLSGISVQNERFVEKLRGKLEPHLKTDIPKRLVFEITESSEITDLDKVNNFVKALQDDGFKVSLDDFGAGSASFQYLHKLHVNAIKIDGQYIMNILDNKRDQSMITNLVRMCTDLGVDVVAERIETREQALLLRKMGVQMGQGYYFAKPLDDANYKAVPLT